MTDTKLVIRMAPVSESIGPMLDQLEAYAEAHALSPMAAHRLALVCEETAANVVMHGADGAGAATYVEIAVDLEPGHLHVAVTDDGRPFDPLAAAPPDTELGIDDREIGGLGIHFIRSMAQSLAYERRDACNRLTAVLDAAD